MEALMIALMVWASAHTGLPMPQAENPLPEIRVLNQCQLDEVVWPNVPGCTYDPAITAVYDMEERVMYLLDTWRGDTLLDVSTVLHELVHHLQSVNEVEARPCVQAAYEAPAYETQFAFIEATGQDPLEVLGINDMRLITVTNCMGY